jgi:hypothetical protein
MKTRPWRLRGRLWVSWVGGLAVLLVGSSPASAGARQGLGVETAPAPVEDRGGSLVVEVDPSNLDPDNLRQWVQDRGAQVLAARAGVLGPEDEIRVHVAGQTFDYRVTVEIRRRGQELSQRPEPLVCGCNSAELLERLESKIGEAADLLLAAARAEQAVEVEVVDGDDEVQEAPTRPTPADRRRRLGRLGIAGVVVAGIGGAAAITGVAMAATGTRSVTTPDYFDRDYRPAGYGFLGVGVTVLAGGLTMVVVDVVRCRRRPDACGGMAVRRGSKRWVTR